MDEEKMDVRSDTQGFAAPILPENGGNLDADFAPKLPFAASGREMALAFFLYLPAYLYLQSAAWCCPPSPWATIPFWRWPLTVRAPRN